MSYKPEELLEVVEELTRKFTSGESTSITYETAQRLMGAVLYGIGIFEAENHNKIINQKNLITEKGVLPRIAYQKGYEMLIQKVKEVKERYNEKILNFCAYENKNYYDTVAKGIPGFFQQYDPRFYPQNTVITMDYRTIVSVGKKTGILAIEEYLEYIYLEQEFMERWSQDYVICILERHQKSYREQFYNISTILLRHALGSIVVKKSLDDAEINAPYMVMEKFVSTYSQSELVSFFEHILAKWIKESYGNNPDMFQYFFHDVEEFVVELKNAAIYQTLPRVVVL